MKRAKNYASTIKKIIGVLCVFSFKLFNYKFMY